MVERLAMLQLDPTAAIAPSADLVAWSRLGSSYRPADLKQALEQDRTLFELNAVVRPMRDLGLFLTTGTEWSPYLNSVIGSATMTVFVATYSIGSENSDP